MNQQLQVGQQTATKYQNSVIWKLVEIHNLRTSEGKFEIDLLVIIRCNSALYINQHRVFLSCGYVKHTRSKIINEL